MGKCQECGKRVAAALGVPFHERTLDSFSDKIITKSQQRSSGLWYAWLDVGPDGWASDPDFAWGGNNTEEQVVLECAARIRADARGIGKFAPHSILTGYDLHFRLMKHWAEKERGFPCKDCKERGRADA